MATVVANVIFTALAGAGVTVGVATAIATVVGQLVVGAAISAVSAALTRRATPGREELKRELSTPIERPAFRHVFAETRAVGSLVSWPVDGNILWGCWLLNSRPSDMSNLGLVLDERDVTHTGNPFDFTDLNGATATNDPFTGHINFWVQRGHETSPPQRFLNDMAYDEVTHPERYKSTDGWQGRTVLWMRLDAGSNDDRQQRWPSVPPLVEMDAQWSKVYDPREVSHDIDDPDTWETSDNQGLILLDVLLNNPVRPYQLLNLNLDSYEWAADVADELVALKSGGTEPRYRASGTIVFSEGVELEDMLAPILTAGASKLTRIGGKLGVIPATLKAPVDTVTTVIDGLSVDWLRPSKELPTRILGSYVSPARGYEDADLPPYEIPGAQTADGGVRKTRSLRLAMVESATQAQRLVKISAYDARRQKTINTVLPPSNINLISGSEATVDFPSEYAAINADYEVVSIHPEIDVTAEGVTLRSTVEMLIVDDTGLAWNAITDEVDIYDEYFDLSTDDIDPPGAIAVTIEDFDTGGTIVPRVRFEFDPSSTASVTLYEWQYRLSGGVWETGGTINATTVDAEGDVFGHLTSVSTTETYDIRVRSVSSNNGFSDWREIEGVGVGFLLTSVTSTSGIASADFTGTAPSAANFEGVKLYVADVGDDFADASAASPVVIVNSGEAFAVTFGDDDAVSEITNGDFSSGSTGWVANGGWSIGAGIATHSSTATQDELETSVSLIDAVDYRWSYLKSGSNVNASYFHLEGSTENTSSGEIADGWHHGVLTAPNSANHACIKSSVGFAGSVDGIHLVKDTADALPLGENDYWIVPVTSTGSEGSPVGPFTLRIY